jgi:ribA/ribD-fused uncharacterized protein
MNEIKVIRSFKGDFEFLSNFSRHAFRDPSDGVLWRTNEHFYQANKTVSMIDRGRIWSASTPGKAKKLGSEVELRENWKFIKNQVMMMGLGLKFTQNEDIKKLLMSLDGYELVEGNMWHDNYWGDCLCVGCRNIEGKNMLGKYLMLMREMFFNK